MTGAGAGGGDCPASSELSLELSEEPLDPPVLPPSESPERQLISLGLMKMSHGHKTFLILKIPFTGGNFRITVFRRFPPKTSPNEKL